MSEPAVELIDVRVAFGPVTALDGLTLRLPRGSVSSILGPNGAGKTTAVETAEGYRRPDSGRVRVLGLDPVADRAEVRARVGVMLQEGGVSPASTARQAVESHARMYRSPLPVGPLLERLGLGARTPYRRLSGGEKQRVKLAVSLVGRPELVFLDEPTAGLDPQGRLVVWDLIRQCRRDGVTVVLTTHLMDEAEELSDVVAIVDEGRLVAFGDPRELTGAVGGALTFRATAGLRVRELETALPGGATVREAPAGCYTVNGEVTPALLSAVTDWCARNDVLADRLDTGAASLQDVFLSLTGRDLRS